MHCWECEEVVTRFESFACCSETYLNIAAELRARRYFQLPLISFSDKFQREKRGDYD